MPREVVPGVIQVAFPKALVNAYVVRADVPTLIDTGTPDAADALLDAIHDAGVQPGDVGRILLTHAHADHAGNARALAGETGAEVHVAPGAAAYVTQGREQPRPKPATPLGWAMNPYVAAVLPWRLDPVAAEPSLEDGARVGPFRVIATPGHSEGHVALLWEERRILFTGDAAAHITTLGPHPVAEDPGVAARSFHSLGEHEFEVAAFGHGRAITGDAAARLRDA